MRSSDCSSSFQSEDVADVCKTISKLVHNKSKSKHRSVLSQAQNLQATATSDALDNPYGFIA